MKSCRWFLVDLPGYLRGDLPPSSKDILVRHLQGCSDCRAEYQKLRRLDALLDNALPPADELPEFQAWFLARLDRVVEDETRATPPRGRGKVALVSALLPLAAAAVLAFLLLRSASAEKNGVDRVAQPVLPAQTLTVAGPAASGDLDAPPSAAFARGAEPALDYTTVRDLDVPQSAPIDVAVETNG